MSGLRLTADASIDNQRVHSQSYTQSWTCSVPFMRGFCVVFDAASCCALKLAICHFLHRCVYNRFLLIVCWCLFSNLPSTGIVGLFLRLTNSRLNFHQRKSVPSEIQKGCGA